MSLFMDQLVSLFMDQLMSLFMDPLSLSLSLSMVYVC